MPTILDASDVHVWYLATTSLDEDAVTAALSLLSAGERQRADRFVFPRDRRDFAAAHALIRRALSLYEEVDPRDWTFEVEPNGKPRVAASPAGGAPLQFNLSHTHGLVACAVTHGGDVGLDVERIDRSMATDAREIAARYFTEEETAFIESGPGDRQVRFAEVWTLKEAFVKAVGRGLSQGLSEFGFGFDGPRGIRFQPAAGENDIDWAFALFAPSDARMAVARRSAERGSRRIIARPFDGASHEILEALRSSGTA